MVIEFQAHIDPQCYDNYIEEAGIPEEGDSDSLGQSQKAVQRR